MKIVLLFLALVFQVPATYAQNLVPDSAVRFAQQELESARLKDPAFKSARINIGYAVRVVGAAKALEFLRSSVDNPATFASDGFFPAFIFPILAADSCVSVLSLIRESGPGKDARLYSAMWPFEMRDVGPREEALVRLHNIFKTDRIWICSFPWSKAEDVIFAEPSDGRTLVVELNTDSVASDSSLVANTRPVGDWASDTKRRLKEFYRMSKPAPADPLDFPLAVLERAQSELADTRFRGMIARYVKDRDVELRLGSGYIQFEISEIETALYAESSVPDPVVFDRDPIYCFPVKAGDEYVAVMNLRRNVDEFGRPFHPGEGYFIVVGLSVVRSQEQVSYLEFLSTRGDAAMVQVDEASTWCFYLLNADGAWMEPVRQSSGSHERESVEAFAARVKPELRRKLLESP